MNNNKRYKNPNYSRIKVQNNFNQSFKGDQFIQSPLDDDQVFDHASQEGGFILPAIAIKLLADKLLSKRPKAITKWLKEVGDERIQSIQVCRNPVTKVIKNLINIVSLGMLKRKMKDKNYDELFHLFLVIRLENGKIYSLEKNQRVTVHTGNKSNDQSDCTSLFALRNYGYPTVREFLNNAEKLKIKGFYQYDGLINNCQKFILDLLNANGIIKYNNFIKQDTNVLAPSYVNAISKGLTNVAGLGDFLINRG